MNGYNGWNKSMTGQRKGYFDNLEITEPLVIDSLNVNDLIVNDNVSGNSFNFNNGKINSVSGTNCSFTYLNSYMDTAVIGSFGNIFGSNSSFILSKGTS